MGTAICTAIAAIATVVAGIVCKKATKNAQRKEAEKDVEKDEKMKKEKREELEKAIFKGDDMKVNERLTKILAGCTVAMACIGCYTEIQYVPADRRIVSITNSWGIACKAVPDVVFAEMCDKLLQLEEKTKEEKVDKRLGE